MFAFLLTLPFQSNFLRTVTIHDMVAFYVTFIASALAMVLMTAPSVQERVHWLRYKNFGVRLFGFDVALLSANIGTALLGVSVVGGVYLVSYALFGLAASVPASIGTAAVLVIGWAVLPIWVGRRSVPEIANVAMSPRSQVGGTSDRDRPSPAFQANLGEANLCEKSEQQPEENQRLALRRLLEGLRTFVPGTTVIFAFLLALPFQAGFDNVGTANMALFYVSFVASAFATVFLVAPSVHERVHWTRRRNFDTSTLPLDLALWTANIGTLLMSITIIAAVYLVTNVVFKDVGLDVAVFIVIAATTFVAWLALPLWIEGRRDLGLADTVTSPQAPPRTTTPSPGDQPTTRSPDAGLSADLEESQQLALRRLLAGLRTFLPAAGIMFAFLLALPFQSGFAKISLGDDIVYYVTFISSALAIILLVAPSVQERIHWWRWGSFSSRSLALDVALRSANIGTVLIGVTIVAGTYLVSSVVYGVLVAIPAFCSLALAAIFVWIWLPSRLEKRRDAEFSATATSSRPVSPAMSATSGTAHVAAALLTTHVDLPVAELEDEQQRALQQLHEGLQAFIPAMAVLFAFFVSLVSQSRFDKVAAHTVAFFVAFTASAAATIMLTAPTVHQHVHWLRFGNFGARTLSLGMALSIANIGTLLMGVAVSASVYLVTAVMFAASFAAGALGGTALVAIFSWVVIPTWVESRREGRSATTA